LPAGVARDGQGRCHGGRRAQEVSAFHSLAIHSAILLDYVRFAPLAVILLASQLGS
jgi:hypothetical protein